MLRNRLARFISFAVSIAAVVIYMPIFFEFSAAKGFWVLLPVWVCLMVGFIVVLEWLEDRMATNPNATPEIHNANFPKPSIRASGWSDSLVASEASVCEAFKSTIGRRGSVIGLIGEDSSELVLRWNKKGWEIELAPWSERTSKIAVRDTSEWAGREIRISGPLSLFRRLPEDWFDQEAAKRVVRAFLGWGEMPNTIAWGTIKYF